MPETVCGLSPTLVLASSSRRRYDLLAQLGVSPVRIVSPDIDEALARGELPRVYALRMACEKAAAVEATPGEVILAGDTVVALGRRVLPRAGDAHEVAHCLGLLSGRRHRVFSAVALRRIEGKPSIRIAETVITFKRLHLDEIAGYAACREGEGKAGGYAIQGKAGAFVRRLSGSYSGVVGLPLYETSLLLKAAGVVTGSEV